MGLKISLFETSILGLVLPLLLVMFVQLGLLIIYARRRPKLTRMQFQPNHKTTLRRAA